MSGAGRVVVVAAVIERGGRVLLGRRTGGPLDGLWEFPGGKREEGETDAEALRREILEEIGIDVEVGARLATADDGIRVIRFYRARYRGGGRPRPIACSALRWARREELPGLAFPEPNRALVAALSRGDHPSPGAGTLWGDDLEVAHGQGEA